jgi:hypothetical protein
MSHSSTELVFSADFGGRDAAAAVLPFFHAIKQACLQTAIHDFPFPRLAFVLRVDGDVHTFGPPTVGNLEVNKPEGYLSVDIVIRRDDRENLVDVLESSLLQSVETIDTALQNNGNACGDRRLWTTALETFVQELRRIHVATSGRGV